MTEFPEMEPAIGVKRAAEQPFEVECRELRWWFIRPEPGQQRLWATYQRPDCNLHQIDGMQVEGRGKVHGVECAEIRHNAFAPDGSEKRRAAFAYGAEAEGMMRWYGWWNLDDELKFYTWREDDFEWDWGGSPVRIRDAGRFRWESDTVVEAARHEPVAEAVEESGAGLCTLSIGKRSHRCLRVIELNDYEGKPSTLSEGFIDALGTVVLYRRYNHADYLIDGEPSGKALSSSPILLVNGITYHLWYDNIPKDSLPGAVESASIGSMPLV